MKDTLQPLQDSIILNMQGAESVARRLRQIHNDTKDKKILEPTRILEQCSLNMKKAAYLLRRDFKLK